MRRSRKQIEKQKSRQAERKRNLPPRRQCNSLAVTAALVVVGIAGYALELDVSLGLGAGQVTGRIAWFDDRGSRSAYGHFRAKGSWPILVVANESGQPIHYFHSFAPGVYGELYDVIRARREAEADLPPPTRDPVATTGRSIITHQSGPPPHQPYVRVLYAGLGRKSVYAFEELPWPP